MHDAHEVGGSTPSTPTSRAERVLSCVFAQGEGLTARTTSAGPRPGVRYARLVRTVTTLDVVRSRRAQNEMADTMRRIVSEFPGIQPRRQGRQLFAEGPANGGGPLLQISATAGTIFIKKQP